MKKNSFTKSISILALFLLSIAAIMWIVMANRFEDYVKNEIVPKLEQNQYWVKTDLEALKIHKYKFSISTGEIILLPNSEVFATKTDQIKFSYNPLKKLITAYFTGNRVETGKGDLGFYHEGNPNDFISFNQEILKGDFSKMRIESKNSKQEVKDVLKNNLISNVDGETCIISGSYNPSIPNSYRLVIDSESKGLQYHNSDYFKRLVAYISNLLDLKDPTLSIGENDLTSLDYNFKEMKIIGPLHAKGKISLELNNERFKSIIQALKGERTFASLLGEFNFFEDLYSLNIDQSTKNSVVKDIIAVSLNNDGNKISTDIELSFSKDLSDGQKSELLPLMSEYIYESVVSQINSIIKNNPNSKVSTKDLVVKDFESIATKILNLKNLDFKLKGSYDKVVRDIAHNLTVKINDNEIDLSGTGKLKEMVYDGDVKVTDPNKLINSAVDFAQSTFYPIFHKANAQNYDTSDRDALQELIKNIKDNGFRALGALNKNATLNPGDTLNMHLHFNPKEFEFKVNNKAFLEIMTDDRVIPFLRGMPKGKTEPEQQHDELHKDIQPAE